jgi:hypothetical protein
VGTTAADGVRLPVLVGVMGESMLKCFDGGALVVAVVVAVGAFVALLKLVWNQLRMVVKMLVGSVGSDVGEAVDPELTTIEGTWEMSLPGVSLGSIDVVWIWSVNGSKLCISNGEAVGKSTGNSDIGLLIRFVGVAAAVGAANNLSGLRFSAGEALLLNSGLTALGVSGFTALGVSSRLLLCSRTSSIMAIIVGKLGFGAAGTIDNEGGVLEVTTNVGGWAIAGLGRPFPRMGGFRKLLSPIPLGNPGGDPRLVGAVCWTDGGATDASGTTKTSATGGCEVVAIFSRDDMVGNAVDNTVFGMVRPVGPTGAPVTGCNLSTVATDVGFGVSDERGPLAWFCGRCCCCSRSFVVFSDSRPVVEVMNGAEDGKLGTVPFSATAGLAPGSSFEFIDRLPADLGETLGPWVADGLSMAS